jgi:hypothetical protein
VNCFVVIRNILLSQWASKQACINPDSGSSKKLAGFFCQEFSKIGESPLQVAVVCKVVFDAVVHGRVVLDDGADADDDGL